MKKRRKTHLLFFLLALIPLHLIPLPITATAGDLRMPRSSIDDPGSAGFRAYRGQSWAHSPQNLTAYPSVKATMRTSTTPLVFLSQFLAATTLADKIVYLLFVVCYSLCIFSWLTKKHPDI